MEIAGSPHRPGSGCYSHRSKSGIKMCQRIRAEQSTLSRLLHHFLAAAESRATPVMLLRLRVLLKASSVVRIIPVFRGDPAVCGLFDLQSVCWSPCISVKLKGRISGS